MGRRANGEGCIRQRKDGRWEGRFTAGYDLLTGKGVYKSVYAPTKKECAEKMAKAIRENTAPYFRRGKGFEDRPLSDWLRSWFDTFCKPTIRPSTISGYTNMIENQIIPLIGNIKLSKLSSTHIQSMYNLLKEKGRLDCQGNRIYEPLSASYIKHIHMVLNSALKHAARERIIPYNPCENCRLPKDAKKEMKILPSDKIGAFLEEANKLNVYAMFYLELTSGLRKCELIALLWEDLDVESRTLKVNKQVSRDNGEIVVSAPKTDHSIRTVTLPQQTVDLLVEEHNKHPDNPLISFTAKPASRRLMWARPTCPMPH